VQDRPWTKIDEKIDTRRWQLKRENVVENQTKFSKGVVISQHFYGMEQPMLISKSSARDTTSNKLVFSIYDKWLTLKISYRPLENAAGTLYN
jgi:hypothetical protein